MGQGKSKELVAVGAGDKERYDLLAKMGPERPYTVLEVVSAFADDEYKYRALETCTPPEVVALTDLDLGAVLAAFRNDGCRIRAIRYCARCGVPFGGVDRAATCFATDLLRLSALTAAARCYPEESIPQLEDAAVRRLLMACSDDYGRLLLWRALTAAKMQQRISANCLLEFQDEGVRVNALGCIARDLKRMSQSANLRWLFPRHNSVANTVLPASAPPLAEQAPPPAVHARSMSISHTSRHNSIANIVPPTVGIPAAPMYIHSRSLSMSHPAPYIPQR